MDDVTAFRLVLPDDFLFELTDRLFAAKIDRFRSNAKRHTDALKKRNPPRPASLLTLNVLDL
jgi:hypothetical protein